MQLVQESPYISKMSLIQLSRRLIDEHKRVPRSVVRVEKYVPGQERRIFLCTFHSFCADILRQHGMHLDINPNFTIYSQDNELQEVLNDAVEKTRNKFELLQNTYKKTLPVIFRLKSLLISPEKCQDRFEDRIFG